MKSDINFKKKLFKILFINKKTLIKVGNKTLSQRSIKKDTMILMNFVQKQNSKIVEVCINDKYLFFLVLIACLFSNKIIYPKKEPIKSFKESLDFFNENQLNEILSNKNTSNSKFFFNNSQFLILETTGTTKKKLMITMANQYLNGCDHSRKLFKYNKSTKLLHCLPIYYNAGLNNTLFAPLLGSSKIIFTDNFDNFKFIKIFKTAKKNKINSIQLMPNMYLSLIFGYRDKKFIQKLKSVISTGSYLYPEIQKKFYNCFEKKILSCYGITELGGALTVQNQSNFIQAGSVGSIKKNIEIKINKKKEILINTPFKMIGYLKNININQIVKFHKKKYFNSKDLGFIKKNILHIVGRSKEIINRGGENISLKNIENVALKFKNVKNVLCVGVKNIFSGENIIMFIEIEKIRKGFKLNFLKYLNRSLDKNSIPSQIIYKKKFPYFANGKMNGRLLKKSILGSND